MSQNPADITPINPKLIFIKIELVTTNDVYIHPWIIAVCLARRCYTYTPSK